MTYSKLIVEARGDVLIVKLNDPATLNAAGTEMLNELAQVFDNITTGALKARAMVLTGEGRGFCSGANLSGRGGGIGPKDGGERLESVVNPMMRQIRDLPVPIVTAVNGPAAGVGCSIALMGDLIVCGEGGYFLQAFRRIGLVPDGGSTWMLPRMIGKARAMEMMLLGEKVLSAAALEWGLVNKVVPDANLLDEAVELAGRLADGPASLAMTRRLVWQALEADHSSALDAERWGQKEAAATADSAEGIAAFLEKRPAKFTGA